VIRVISCERGSRDESKQPLNAHTMKIYGLKSSSKRKNTSSEKPEYVRPCIECIETEGWPGGLSGMEKWYASILLMPEYKAYGLSEDEAESRL
jgi:hypothetical protein